MKKLSTLLILLSVSLLCSNLFAKEISCTFLGVPLGSPLKEYRKALISHGFEKIDDTPDSLCYQGPYLGVDQVYVTIRDNFPQDYIHIYFPMVDKMESLESFNKISSPYAEEYGEPVQIREYRNGYTINDARAKFWEGLESMR